MKGQEAEESVKKRGNTEGYKKRVRGRGRLKRVRGERLENVAKCGERMTGERIKGSKN